MSLYLIGMGVSRRGSDIDIWRMRVVVVVVVVFLFLPSPLVLHLPFLYDTRMSIHTPGTTRPRQPFMVPKRWVRDGVWQRGGNDM